MCKCKRIFKHLAAKGVIKWVKTLLQKMAKILKKFDLTDNCADLPISAQFFRFFVKEVDSK